MLRAAVMWLHHTRYNYPITLMSPRSSDQPSILHEGVGVTAGRSQMKGISRQRATQ